jgi:hypothetical protein
MLIPFNNFFHLQLIEFQFKIISIGSDGGILLLIKRDFFLIQRLTNSFNVIFKCFFANSNVFEKYNLLSL